MDGYTVVDVGRDPMQHQPAYLYYNVNEGMARKDGVTVKLTNPPDIIPHLRAVRYHPHRGELRVSGEPWRQMTRAECDKVLIWLDGIVQAVMGAL